METVYGAGDKYDRHTLQICTPDPTIYPANMLFEMLVARAVGHLRDRPSFALNGSASENSLSIPAISFPTSYLLCFFPRHEQYHLSSRYHSRACMSSIISLSTFSRPLSRDGKFAMSRLCEVTIRCTRSARIVVSNAICHHHARIRFPPSSLALSLSLSLFRSAYLIHDFLSRRYSGEYDAPYMFEKAFPGASLLPR